MARDLRELLLLGACDWWPLPVKLRLAALLRGQAPISRFIGRAATRTIYWFPSRPRRMRVLVAHG